LKHMTAAKATEQLAPLAGVLHDVSAQSTPRQQLANAVLPNETVLALMRAFAALSDLTVKAALGAAAAREDDVSKEAP
jgi:hypothetical protein